MNTFYLVFKKDYWDRLYRFFEEYFYNYFDESYESEHIILSSIERIPLFIAFVLVFHFQVLICKADWKQTINIPNEKIISWESIKEVPELVEPPLNENEADCRNGNFYEMKSMSRSLFNLSGFMPLAVIQQKQLFIRNCSLLH